MEDRKKIIIFHSDVPPDATPDELDVFDEANFIAGGLKEAGHDVVVMPFKLNFNLLTEQLKDIKPDAAFNLVESIKADGRLIHIAPSLFDHFKLPFYGCSTDAIILSSNKLYGKKVMENSGIPTAKHICLSNIDTVEIGKDEKFIFKSVWEHASVGLEENCIRSIPDKKELYDYFRECRDIGKQTFAESYIDGREFNVAMIGSTEDFEALPVAEITFVDYPEDKYKIVDYKAKWVEDTFEYDHTIRSFEPWEKERELCMKLQEISFRCWKAFELNGYARVDFRVDAEGNPFVLEVNANPCISPVGGFIAATIERGFTFSDVLNIIMKEPNNKRI
jgi:D-alanine-D-alanine ligase